MSVAQDPSAATIIIIIAERSIAHDFPSKWRRHVVAIAYGNLIQLQFNYPRLLMLPPLPCCSIVARHNGMLRECEVVPLALNKLRCRLFISARRCSLNKTCK
jgi:hypothetical protein